jgi:hypothetical protein
LTQQANIAGSTPDVTAYTDLNNSFEEESRSSKRLITDLIEEMAILQRMCSGMASLQKGSQLQADFQLIFIRRRYVLMSP